MDIDPQDLEISTYKKQGPSGWIASNSIGVRITHRPTGLYAESDADRSVHRNKATAYEELLRKLSVYKSELHDIISISTPNKGTPKMIMFSLKKGRTGLLISPDGECTPWELREDYSPFDDDIVYDPIRLYNNTRQGITDEPRNKMEETAKRLARQGYTVFRKESAKGKEYGFAVFVREGDSDID